VVECKDTVVRHKNPIVGYRAVCGLTKKYRHDLQVQILSSNSNRFCSFLILRFARVFLARHTLWIKSRMNSGIYERIMIRRTRSAILLEKPVRETDPGETKTELDIVSIIDIMTSHLWKCKFPPLRGEGPSRWGVVHAPT
jgi:hypothetical protein